MPTTSYWQSQPFGPPSREGGGGAYDVAVVGGGVIGAATAYALRWLRPHLRIGLVEARSLAWGASGRNAGFLLPGVSTDYASAAEIYGRERTRRLWGFTAENIHETAALETSDLDLRLTGSLLAAGSPEEAERLQQAADWMREDGIRTSYLGAEATNRRIRGEGFCGSIALHEGGCFHPTRLVRYLVEGSEADVIEEWPVEAIERAPVGVRLEGPRGHIDAERAVIALNAYLPQLWPGAERWVRPVRAQMLATTPAAPLLGMPVYSHEGYYYLRQLPDGRLLVGGARHRHVDSEVGYADATTPTLQADLEAYLSEHFPAAGEVSVERRWSGTMGFSPDGLPVTGALSDVPDALFACGFTGHGMGYAVRFGQLMARLALGEKDEAADLFQADRLAGSSDPPAPRIAVTEA